MDNKQKFKLITKPKNNTECFLTPRKIDPGIEEVLKLLGINFNNFEFQNHKQSEISISLLN